MPWVDMSVGSAIAKSAGNSVPPADETAASVAAAPPPPPTEDAGELAFPDWTLPPDPKRSKVMWAVPPMILLAVVALWVTVFVDRDEGQSSSVDIAGDTTPTTQAATTTVASTTSGPSTTTSSTTTTTIFFPPADSWSAVGDPIQASDLTLKAAGIGPIDIGVPIGEAAGALVASLGPARNAGIDSGLCPGSAWYWLEWDDLLGLFEGYTPTAEFIGYRYQTDGDGEPDPNLETLSGIRLGDTVATLNRTYASYTVSFEVVEGKDFFRLSDGGELLLWGPVTSTGPRGLIEGIYSPITCPNER
jgi:hypothetical protein